MKVRCPNIKCKNRNLVVKDGSYRRKSDSKTIPRFKCCTCKKRFSSATFSPTYRQNKRRVNPKLRELLASGISMRRSARLLKIHYITVARKVNFLAKLADMKHDKYLEFLRMNPVKMVQLDDLITLEHTKCKPLSVTIAIDELTRKILAINVSSMPAFGHLAKISRKKYGWRKDEREKGLKNVLSKIQKSVAHSAMITTDEHQLYPKNIKRYFPHATHKTYKGERSSVYGQGELKKVKFDPLFNINHTCAMLRANINRLIRKSWCTTKKPHMLMNHLKIYMEYHNSHLV